jgi:hypothetical protein
MGFGSGADTPACGYFEQSGRASHDRHTERPELPSNQALTRLPATKTRRNTACRWWSAAGLERTFNSKHLSVPGPGHGLHAAAIGRVYVPVGKQAQSQSYYKLNIKL